MIVAEGSAARSIASIAFSTLRKRSLPVVAMDMRARDSTPPAGVDWNA